MEYNNKVIPIETIETPEVVKINVSPKEDNIYPPRDDSREIKEIELVDELKIIP